MLLTITTTRRPAADLGYLLHKHSDRFQSYDLSFGKAHVFDPEAVGSPTQMGVFERAEADHGPVA
ncbi:hypothetical protein BH23PLA1_BH23PLA1_19360 [soil metagenome]